MQPGTCAQFTATVGVTIRALVPDTVHIAYDLACFPPFFLAGVYVSDVNGALTASWNMPPGQFVDETIWLETIAFLPSSAIQIGPAVGGVIR